MITEEQRTKAYREAPEQFKTLYSGPVAMALNKEMAEKYNISDESKPAFLDVTGDVILGFYKIADLPKLLQKEVGMDRELAQKLVAELIDVWGLVVQREEEEARAKKDEVAGLADKIEAIEPSEVATTLKTEENMAKESEPVVKPIHTMATDVGKMHGYGALPENQDETSFERDEPVVQATPQTNLTPTESQSPDDNQTPKAPNV